MTGADAGSVVESSGVGVAISSATPTGQLIELLAPRRGGGRNGG
jgi:hypothetical protein